MSKINWKAHGKNLLIVLIVFALTTILAFVLEMREIHAENLLMLYLLGIIIIVTETKSFLTTVLSSIIFIMTHNFMFLEPKYDWHPITGKSFALSATIFLIVALIVNLLVSRLQRQLISSRENTNLHKKLYDASEGLLAVHGRDKVIEYSDKALTELAGAEVEFHFAIDKFEHNEAIIWCFKNSAKCGHGETEFHDVGCKYIPIRSKNKTVGVVSIDCTQKELSKEAEECIIALLSQITIAIEREDLESARAKEEATITREHVKASVMKSLSHDMYPRITQINKDSKNMRENINLMEESEVIEHLQTIEDESQYLCQIVDNILDITKDAN